MAQREANILARNSYDANQASWRRNVQNGHPVGPPPGCFGGTGCSFKGGTGQIHTCEPDTRKTLIAEAFARNPNDGTWYSSRAWR